MEGVCLDFAALGKSRRNMQDQVAQGQDTGLEHSAKAQHTAKTQHSLCTGPTVTAQLVAQDQQ